jgi:hypothetical protein
MPAAPTMGAAPRDPAPGKLRIAFIHPDLGLGGEQGWVDFLWARKNERD